MSSPMIDPVQLASALATDDPTLVLDVRWRLGGPSGREDYVAGHIPGAVFVDLDIDVCGPAGSGGRYPPAGPVRRLVE